MSTISFAAPVLTATAPAQPVASSSSTGAANRSDSSDNSQQQSFASCLKKSSADTGKEEITATTPGLHASPKTAARGEKEPRRQKTDEALLGFPGTPVAQTQVIDPRSVLPSWQSAPNVSNEASGGKKSDSVQDKAQQAGTPGSSDTAAMQATVPLAFGITIANPAPVAVASAQPVQLTSVKQPAPKESPSILVPDSVPAKDEKSQVDETGQVTVAKGGPQIPAPTNAPVPMQPPAPATGQKTPAAQAKDSQPVMSAAPASPSIQKAQPDDQPNSGNQHQGQQKKEKDTDSSASTSVAASSAAPAHDRELTAPTIPTVKTDAVLTTTPVQVPSAYSSASTSVSGKASTPAVSTTQVTAITEPPSMPQVRPNSIDLRVSGAGDSQVDIRVSQRAGDVEVTVRTPDTGLAQSLRQHLPELSDRLSENGIHGDVWQPASAQTSADTSGQSADPGASRWQGEQQNQQQQRQQQEEANSQQQPDSRQASWLSEFNNADKEGV